VSRTVSVCSRIGFTNKHQYADPPYRIGAARAPQA